MDYQKIYNKLTESRKNRVLEEGQYYEKHHIVPKCLGGTNDADNLVVLTFREHYMAHLLLSKIHRHHSGIQYAFLCMLRKQPTGERILTSRMYQTIKYNFSQFKKKYCTIENPGKSIKSRNGARKRMLENNPISLDPSKNRTAQPIRIYFENGDVKEYSYAKKFCIEENIPYSTMKSWLKTGNTKSKKHGILKIERITKNENI